MADMKKAKRRLMMVVVVLYVLSIVIAIAAGGGVVASIIDYTLGAFQIDFSMMGFVAASNPLILLSKFLNASIFPILTAVLAAGFFDFIGSINMRERIAMARIRRLRNHVVVAPYNNFSRTLLAELRKANKPTVVITENRRDLNRIYREGELAMYGDIRLLSTFRTANIGSAECMVACSDNDVQNALISITARSANPHIKVFGKANRRENSAGLRKAGISNALTIEDTAGEEIAEIVSRKVSLGKV